MAAEDVTIARDRWGIGHASAPDAAGAFRAQGWLAASDRFWQMEWDRRRAAGRWAEVAGPTAVAEDRFFRRLNLPVAAKSDWDVLSADPRAMVEAYTDGVNAWLDANAGHLPPEFEHHPSKPEPWEPWQCLAVYKVRHVFMGTLHRKLWRAAVLAKAGPEVALAVLGDPGTATPMVPGSSVVGSASAAASKTVPAIDLVADAAELLEQAADDLAAIPDLDGASNSWAVHGSRTATGKPLLAGDPHRGIEFPNVYYQCHLACDEFDVIGLAFPGVPGFAHFGHNESVAWCITHGMADDTDVFVETEQVAATRTEHIEVFGAEQETVVCADTERGPVVLGEPDGDRPALSMMWTGIHGTDTTFECLWPMLRARSVDELEDAVRDWVIPVNNLLTADVGGDISFRIRGRLIERPAANRWTPVPADAEHSWTGLEPIADERLHRWRNPERGYLVTANNRTSDDGPYVSLDFAGPARHDRVIELLEPLTAATVADMTTIHGDTVSLVAPAVVDFLRSAAPITEQGQALHQLVLAWDRDVTSDSLAAVVYAGFRRLWALEVGERLGIGSPAVGELVGRVRWPSSASASRALFEAASAMARAGTWRLVPGLGSEAELNAALGAIFDRLGSDEADFGTRRWEEVHTMVSPHPLAAARPDLAHLHPPVDGCPGDGDTVRCASVAPLTGERAATSSVARYVFDLSDWDRSGWVVPHGVSGVRGSGHDIDQRSAWLACELVPMAYSSTAVAAVTVSTTVLA